MAVPCTTRDSAETRAAMHGGGLVHIYGALHSSPNLQTLAGRASSCESRYEANSSAGELRWGEVMRSDVMRGDVK